MVLQRLSGAMSAGMVTSVDMLYGLPGQSAPAVLTDVARLVDVGIHGVSLYRLNLSSQNRELMQRFQCFNQQSIRDFVMLAAAEELLLAAGYRKNHYVHYALPQDTDRYFRYRVWGEDLLGLGASASGSFGQWEYVCHRYPEYLQANERELPISAVARSRRPRDEAVLAAWLMAGEVPAEVAAGHADGGALPRWVDAGLLVPNGSGYRLTAGGSWLIADMLAELRQA